MIRAGLVALALAAPGLAAALPVAAQERVAVPNLDFTDTSGEVRDQTAQHAAQLALFAETLRAGLEEGGIDVVVPECDPPCSPGTTPFAAMAAASRGAGADRVLVGGLHKMSTLIGMMKLTLLDLDADKVVCDRWLSYRGDNAEAWVKAAEFAAADVLKACFGAPGS